MLDRDLMGKAPIVAPMIRVALLLNEGEFGQSAAGNAEDHSVTTVLELAGWLDVVRLHAHAARQFAFLVA